MNPLGRLYHCIVCGEGSETWGESVRHMYLHLTPIRPEPWQVMECAQVASLLTTIRMAEDKVRS